MQPCNIGVLSLQLLLVSGSAVPSVKVKLHDPAVLSCSENCSGLAEWTLFSNSRDVLAQCNQTSCQSKEGFQMFHDQYLKGNIHLIIPDADFSKRNTYTCSCDGVDLCDVRLQIEPLHTQVQVKPGETLRLNWSISEPVEVIYNSTGADKPSSGLICTVNGHSLQSKPEYTERLNLTSVLELRGMKTSDSGVYITRDTENNKDINIYTVTVRGDQPDTVVGKEAAMQVLVALMGTVLITVCAVSLLEIVLLWRQNKQLRMNGHCSSNVGENSL